MAADPEVRTHVTFRSTLFNQTEARPHFINPGCFGDDCAAWLVALLRSRGWSEIADAWQEDWGWQTGGARGGRKFLVSVGLMEDDEPEWLVHVDDSVGWFARLRGRGGESVARAIVGDIHDALAAAPEISSVRWHFADAFMKGIDLGAPRPDAPRAAGEHVD